MRLPWPLTGRSEEMRLIEAALSDPSSSGTVICGAAAPETTVVVGVDDVHLLDELSTFVLHQIVARRAAKVVLTFRGGEPIATGTQELWRAGQFERLDLQPLAPDETAKLLSATLGGSMDSQAASRLCELVRGNVLYLRHIVEQEVSDGRLQSCMASGTGPVIRACLVAWWN